jgi:hypothetical protein
VAGAGGVAQVHALEAISKQLQKNAAVQHKHSPGLPTSLAVHASRCIAVGTDRSLVLVFDHFQEVRQILGNTADAAADGPVTSLDVSFDASVLVSGYVSGRVVLWDINKGTALKTLPDVHAAPVTTLRFFPAASYTGGGVGGVGGGGAGVGGGGGSGGGVGGGLRQKIVAKATSGAAAAAAGAGGGGSGSGAGGAGGSNYYGTSLVSVDTRGCVNKVEFGRTLFGMGSYTVKTECLLDGAAGQVPTMSVLPPWKPVPSSFAAAGSSSSSSSSSSRGGKGGDTAAVPQSNRNPVAGYSFIAISSERSSFVVAVEPFVRVLHKWVRPPSVLGDASEPFLPCLSWGWALVKVRFVSCNVCVHWKSLSVVWHEDERFHSQEIK